MPMHYAKLRTSPRLQRVLGLLSSGREYSTMDIIRRANVCAVNSIISEIRHNGIAVKCRVSAGVYFYRLGA